MVDERGRETHLDDEVLTLPHPRAHQRGFVLVPWLAMRSKKMRQAAKSTSRPPAGAGSRPNSVSMVMITVPIFIPLSKAVGIDQLVLGVIYLLTMEIALLTPPFGLLLFVMRGVVGEQITMIQIYRAVTPFVAIKLLVLALIVAVPQLAGFF